MNNNLLENLQALSTLPPLPLDLRPETLEYRDQKGLLFSVTPLGQIEEFREPSHVPEYLSIYLNGDLVYFYDFVSENCQLNRLSKAIEWFNLVNSSEEV